MKNAGVKWGVWFLPFLCMCSPLATLADSGGPYEFVPDLRESEKQVTPVVRAIPDYAAPLDFYVAWEPELVIDPQTQEPTTFRWKPQVGGTANVERLEPGGTTFAIRYIPGSQLEKGTAFAHGLLLVHADKEGQFHPVYYTCAGVIEDLTATCVSSEQGERAYEIVRRYSGNGGFRDRIRLVWDGNHFRRQSVSP